MPRNGHKRDARRFLLRAFSITTVATVAVVTVGCGRLDQLKAMKSFKEANQAYAQQDYKKAADLYEQTVQADQTAWIGAGMSTR